METLVLSEIWIYPIKSLGGIRVTKAKVLEKGLLHDRRWMLLDANGIFMTQRVYPQMALFQVMISNNQLTIIKRSGSGHQPAVTVEINTPLEGATRSTMVWDDEVNVTEVSSEVSHWFSRHLGVPCKLVHFPENNPRPVHADHKLIDENVSLADAYPFLIIGQRSLDDLNFRMDTPLPMNRFRPNFVFTGGAPYEEDFWKNFSIGKNRFVGVKPCSRCVLTTVNQDTAEKGAEPLITLSTYRKQKSKIHFGQNVIAVDHGEVAVGDEITVN